MQKVKVTAQGMLDIVQGIFADNDIDILNDEAKKAFDAETIQEALNVKYYTFKYRPASTEQILQELRERDEPTNELMGIDRAFCCFSMGSVERVFTKDIDQVVVEGVLDFWVQTHKLPLVEFLVDKANRELTGQRLPVTFQPGNEVRKAAIVFDTPGVPELDLESQIGEAARISVGVMIALNPDVITYADYTASFDFRNKAGEIVSGVTVPLSSLSFVSTMTQKAVPQMASPNNVGNVNLSRAMSFVLVFDGYNNAFVNFITDKALASQQTGQESTDNNQPFVMTLTRGTESYTHTVVSKDHQVTVAADTGNETHTLSLVTRGI